MTEALNGDVRISYEVIGAGEPLLFIHGLGYDRLGWGPLPHRLADDFQVVLFDNRGVGESDVPEGPYAVQQLAEDAVPYLKQAVTSEPGNSEAHAFLADAYEQVGDVTAAAAERARADSLKRAPESH